MKYTVKVFFSLLAFFLLIYFVISAGTLHAIYQKTIIQEKESMVNQQKNIILLLSTRITGNEEKESMIKNGEFIAATKSGDFELLDEKGELVFSTNQRLFDKYALPSKVSKQSLEISQMVSEKKKKIMYATAKIPNTDYYLVTYHQAKNYEQTLTASLFYFRAILFFLLLAILPVTYFLSSMILKPINRLIQVIQAITEGKTEMRASVQTNDEIGLLSQNLNRMADKLNHDLEIVRNAKEKQDLFVSSFSHEVRTPLTSIIGYAQMLRWEELEPSAAESVDYILEESNRLKNLSNDILKLMELEKAEITVQPISSQEIDHDLSRFLKGIEQEFSYMISFEPAILLIDASLFKLLSLNILSNALDAIGKDGKLTIEGWTDKNRYMIRFSDNGKGIPDDLLEKVTDEFFTGNSSRTSNHLGLGLSLVKKIVELHDGLLVIESEVGSGTTITIDFALGGEAIEK